MGAPSILDNWDAEVENLLSVISIIRGEGWEMGDEVILAK